MPLQSNSNLPKWKRQPTKEWVSYHWKYFNYLGRGWVAICQRECKGDCHMGKLQNKINSAPFISRMLWLVMRLVPNEDQSRSTAPSSARPPPQSLSAPFWLPPDDRRCGPAVSLFLSTLETCRDSGLWWRSLQGVRQNVLFHANSTYPESKYLELDASPPQIVFQESGKLYHLKKKTRKYVYNFPC